MGLNVMYFFPIIHTAFFKKPEGSRSDAGGIKEASIFMLVPIAITATVSIIFFFYPNLFYIEDLVKTAIDCLGLGVHP